MAARTPRRSFASPFVITLAVVPACYTTSNEPPPSPRQEPPRVTDPSGPDPSPAPTVVANPPRPEPAPAQESRPGVIVNPPRPQPPSPAERAWTLSKGASGCEALAVVDCPKPAPGGPMISCNPPPPVAYPCPDGVDLTAPRTIITVGNGCELSRAPEHCPPGKRCNPPPPKAVPCPSR